jgi:hypothetical protein
MSADQVSQTAADSAESGWAAAAVPVVQIVGVFPGGDPLQNDTILT